MPHPGLAAAGAGIDGGGRRGRGLATGGCLAAHGAGTVLVQLGPWQPEPDAGVGATLSSTRDLGSRRHCGAAVANLAGRCYPSGDISIARTPPPRPHLVFINRHELAAGEYYSPVFIRRFLGPQ